MFVYTVLEIAGIIQLTSFTLVHFPKTFTSQSTYVDITMLNDFWFTLIGFESIGEIHSLKEMENSSVDSKDLFPLNYDCVHMKNIIVV